MHALETALDHLHLRRQPIYHTTNKRVNSKRNQICELLYMDQQFFCNRAGICNSTRPNIAQL